MSTPVGYRPSPLGHGHGSPRSSPFRRPEPSVSPSPSPFRRPEPSVSPLPSPFRQAQTTPTPSPSRASYAHGGTASLFGAPSPVGTTTTAETWTPRRVTVHDHPESPPAMQPTSPRPSASRTLSNGNAMSQLQPTQVRTLREGFQILDRDSDGVVNKEDVVDMLNQLGLPHTANDIAEYFPPSGPQTITMAVFLNSLATSLAAMSPAAELLSAFSAFDDDDSGQIDLAELRDALLNTAPEPGEQPLTVHEVDKVINGFTGRRAFSKHMVGGAGTKRGEVFKYQEFVASIVGGNGSADQKDAAES